MAFKMESGDWTRYKELPSCVEVDFHWSDGGAREVPYWEAMEQVSEVALESLKKPRMTAPGTFYLLTAGLPQGKGKLQPVLRSVS